jgi:hypothetical protein
MVIKAYVAKPVTVHGIEWTGKNLEEIKGFCNSLARMSNGYLVIETTEGSSRASVGDIIIRGTQGEFYPVKPNVMKSKYEEVRH